MVWEMHWKKEGLEAGRPGCPFCAGPGKRRWSEQVGRVWRRGRTDTWDLKEVSVVPVTCTAYMGLKDSVLIRRNKPAMKGHISFDSSGKEPTCQ